MYKFNRRNFEMQTTNFSEELINSAILNSFNTPAVFELAKYGSLDELDENTDPFDVDDEDEIEDDDDLDDDVEDDIEDDVDDELDDFEDDDLEDDDALDDEDDDLDDVDDEDEI